MNFGKMSRLTKKNIPIPPGVNIEIKEEKVIVRGPKGELHIDFLPFTSIVFPDKDSVKVECLRDNKQGRANSGTMFALLRNAILGVKEGFSKRLVVNGIGYRVALEGKILVLNVGFSHPVKFDPPPGVEIEIEKNNIIKVSGIDKQLVGQVAAQIRSIKKPEPYKGKGIFYEGETIRRKAGKKAVAAT